MQRSQPQPAPPRFVALAQELLAAGRPIPVPLERAVGGETVPLALSTRADLPVWCELRGYSTEQTARLMKAVGELVRTPRYLEAVAADLAERHDVDGKPVEPVAREHVLTAALMLHAREVRKTTREART